MKISDRSWREQISRMLNKKSTQKKITLQSRCDFSQARHGGKSGENVNSQAHNFPISWKNHTTCTTFLDEMLVAVFLAKAAHHGEARENNTPSQDSSSSLPVDAEATTWNNYIAFAGLTNLQIIMLAGIMLYILLPVPLKPKYHNTKQTKSFTGKPQIQSVWMRHRTCWEKRKIWSTKNSVTQAHKQV